LSEPVTAFDPDFLSVSAPLPVVPSGLTVRALPFTHFTVLLQPGRRLAVVTGVNLDGAQLLDLERGDDWHLDPRVPAEEQTGPEVYADNDLDRGHLVRRRDPVWGDAQTAAQANLDSFTYVNAAPQAALFNQGELLWAGLENYILDHARANGQRLSVFTAPVLATDDPPYRGIQVPRRFWKIAAWATSDGATGGAVLASAGYVLDQSEVLDPLLQSTAEPPPLGAYLTYQVPLVDIATLTGLDLGPLQAADRLPSPAPVPPGDLGPSVTSERWVLLRRSSDMRL
jgi:endonuclease G, mitochondrial